jgi:hypothetical protein
MADPPPPLYALRAHTTDVTALCLCAMRADNVIGESSSRRNVGGAGLAQAAVAAAAQPRMVLASGSTDGMLKLWDLASRRVCVEVDEHGGRGIIGLVWVAQDARLVSQGRDGYIRVRQVRAVLGEQDNLQLELGALFVMEHGSYTFTRLSYLAAAAGGLIVAPASNDTFFEVWGARTGCPVIAHCVARKQGGKTGMVMSLKLVMLGEIGVDHDNGRGRGLWERAMASEDEAKEKIVCVDDDDDDDGDDGHDDGDAAAAGIESGGNGAAEPRGLAGGTTVERMPCMVAVIVGVESGEIGLFPDAANTANGISISSGSAHACADTESPVASKVLGLTGDDAAWISAHEEPVLCMDVAVRRSDPSSLVGISGSADTSICVFTVHTKDDRWSFGQIHKISLKTRGVADVRLRPDRRLFAAACWDGQVRVYSVKKRRQLAVLRFHDAGVHAVAFPALDTPAEEAGMLVSASRDARIAVWRMYPPAN